eukprot:TRINITY_DN32823_c0_g1_i1.p1 TRINITY_DN32823_c0_g1~~TRINITY_DN32823_c0_g1_i1.p1  ORF type:complete len:660 (+),score=97.11 TRINITY_DN32823_c0_g1_i1:56-2035(+)
MESPLLESGERVGTAGRITVWKPKSARQTAALRDFWARTTRASSVKVTAGIRGLWPHVAAMYATCNFAENLMDLLVLVPGTPTPVTFWICWVVVEPFLVIVCLWLALRVPRDSLWADFAFLSAIFADLVMGSSLNLHVQGEDPPAYYMIGVLLSYYTVVSMFVFAGFHMISIIAFWVATTVTIYALGGTQCCGYESAVVSLFGGIVVFIASFIEYRITVMCEKSEAQHNAEQVLLECATAGSCVVDANTSEFTELSPNLEKVLQAGTSGGHRLLDFVAMEDVCRAETLLREAGAGQLGAAVVTLRLGTTASGSHGGAFRTACQLQDARLIAYSTSQITIKVCLQLLGEARPMVEFAPIVQFVVTESGGGFCDGELSPPASNVGSGSQRTAPLEVAGWPSTVLQNAFYRLPGQGSPAVSQSTAPVPWADPHSDRLQSTNHNGVRGSPTRPYGSAAAASGTSAAGQVVRGVTVGGLGFASTDERSRSQGSLAEMVNSSLWHNSAFLSFIDSVLQEMVEAKNFASRSVLEEARRARADVLAQHGSARRLAAATHWLRRLRSPVSLLEVPLLKGFPLSAAAFSHNAEHWKDVRLAYLVLLRRRRAKTAEREAGFDASLPAHLVRLVAEFLGRPADWSDASSQARLQNALLVGAVLVMDAAMIA